MTSRAFVCRDYEAQRGMVFVETEEKSDPDPETGYVETIRWWKEVASVYAKSRPHLKIITCSKCKRPAVVVDHFWPYYTEHCRCKWHRKKT